ncbi:MAG: hypothetical protein J5I98_32905 [Phaeodactylibacter sp.]|nr:hypothetical protein [Phaeodactylibacter sp.]
MKKTCSILCLYALLLCGYTSSAQNSFCQDVAIAYDLPDDLMEREAYKKVVRDLTYILSTLSSDCCSYISLVEVNQIIGRAERTLKMVNEEGDIPVRVMLRAPGNLLSIQKIGFGAGHYQFYLKFEQLEKVPDKENTYLLGETRETKQIHFTEEDLLSGNESGRKKDLAGRLYKDLDIFLQCKRLRAFLGANDSQKHDIIIKGPSGARIYVNGEFKNTSTIKLTLGEGFYTIEVKSDSLEWSRDIHLSHPYFINVSESEMKLKRVLGKD